LIRKLSPSTEKDVISAVSQSKAEITNQVGSCARKPPSLAVALNCGTGSSFLKALVKAFDKLPHRPGREFRILRLEVEPVDLGQKALGSLQLAIDERRVEDQLRGVIGDLGLLLGLSSWRCRGSKFR
jgi:hypothetical protein